MMDRALLLIYIFTMHFTPLLCQTLDLESLMKIVTQNNSKEWLRKFMISRESTNPYCKLCCIDVALGTIGKHCGSHTMCIYADDKPGPSCKGYLNTTFSDKERKVILDAHNTLRHIVASGGEQRGAPGPQPSAANMRMMVWDDELTAIAERWAAQCIYGHDLCRDVENYPIGQNIAYGLSASSIELSFIKMWYDGVQDLSHIELRTFNSSKTIKSATGKYTQIVWADTYLLGCARAIYQRSHKSDVTYREHLICNYAPTGNIPGQSVYKIGEPCSACQEGTTCSVEYPSLCRGDNIREMIEHEKKLLVINAYGTTKVHVYYILILCTFLYFVSFVYEYFI